jgi:pseudouridylate synthase
MNPNLNLSEEVSEAIAAQKPIVALESTIITHGMPFPANAQMAGKVEAVIRAEGAVPATIAVLKGRLKIGLTADETAELAQTAGAMKLSRADLPFAMATGATGGTTVAATMMAAALAGIKVFATGGIGGVHRGAAQSFDISADLEEFARSPVIVVCAGAKAVLDLEKTLEVLETKGVPIVTYGQDALPAFWSSASHLNSPLRLDTPQQIADFQRMRAALSVSGGMLVANPIPQHAQIPFDEMALFIDAALKSAVERKISGKAVTPYLLGKVLELTEGRSLTANIALVENNARLAARIAIALG